MSKHTLSRRAMLQVGAAAMTGLSLLDGLGFPRTAFAQTGDEVIPWLDQPAENPVPEILVNFWGTDAGEETVREQTITQNFARSMSLEDAMSPYNILCYEMNGESLPQPNGYPLRLIAPGWYGVANVKWLKGIEVRSTRLMNRFMARDYVTLRGEEVNGETVWTESSVGRARLKSAPGRVVRNGDTYRIDGAAWGALIKGVEVQIDDGDWQEAELDTENRGRFAWRFWSLDWADAAPGEHTITSRATSTHDEIQPAADDPMLVNKVTYWESNGQITRTIELPE